MPTNSKAVTPVHSNKLAIGLKCSECLHFKGPASPHYADKCSKTGVLPFAKACKFYTPDLTRIKQADGSTELFAALANAAKGMEGASLRILAYSLLRQEPLKKVGLRLGQPLYVYLPPTLGMPREIRTQMEKYDLHYIDQYYKGYVIGAVNHGDSIEVYISPSEPGKADPYTISLTAKEGGRLPEYVVGGKNFRKRRTRLEAEGKTKMPKETRKAIAALLERPWRARPLVDDDVPTIDTVPKEWFERGIEDEGIIFHSRKKKKKKGSEMSVRETKELLERKAKKSNIKKGAGGRLILNEV